MDYETLLPQKGITIGVYVNPKDSSVMNEMPIAMAKTDEWGYFCLRGLKRMPYTSVLAIAIGISFITDEMPIAMAKTDEWGYFCLRGLKRMPYTIYAYKDANNNSLYDAGSNLSDSATVQLRQSLLQGKGCLK